jgi:uncharacterized protein (TIGR03083 family)
MDRDDVWTAIDDQRRRLAEILEDLSEQEWHHPSLCRGWTVRQVAAHVALQNTTWSMMPRAVLDMVKSGGMNGAIHEMACRHAENPTSLIIAEIRDRIGVWRPLPSLTYQDTAVDYLVHAQDIAVPLGRRLDMPADATVVAANRVWTSETGCSMPARSWPGTGSSPIRRLQTLVQSQDSFLDRSNSAGDLPHG